MGTIDELKRLQSLLNEGAISQDEFEMLKMNVISSDVGEELIEANRINGNKNNDVKTPSSARNSVLKKITCSNCGAELLFEPTTQLASCNFCNSQFEIQKSVDEEVIIPEGIVPFSVTKQQYEERALRYLSEGEFTPIDILETSVFSSINGIYLPVWYYSGKYKGNWSASSGYDYEEEYQVKRNGKWEIETRIVTDWRPSSGNCDGDLLVTGYAAEDFKPELITFTWQTLLRKSSIKPYDSKYTMGFNLMEFKLDEDVSWEKYGNEAAEHYVRSLVYPRIPGDHYKDLHVEAVYDKDKPIRIYYPVWITYYKYKGVEYYVWMDGNNPSKVFGSRPVDEKLKSKAELFSKLMKAWYWIAGVWFVIGVISHIVAGSNSPSSGYTADQEAWLNFGITVFAILGGIFPILWIANRIQRKVVPKMAQKRRDAVLKRINKMS